jgi:hypothetical protein
VDLGSVGLVRVYVTYLESVCSYLWIVCGLLSQLLFSACLFGIPIYMLLVSTVMLHILMSLFFSCKEVNVKIQNTIN